MGVFSTRVPLRFLREGYTRLVLTVTALAFGVALVCAFDAANRAVLRTLTGVIDAMAGHAVLQVWAGEGGLFRERVLGAVLQVPGVEVAVPVVTATAFTPDERGELLTIHGVRGDDETAVRTYEVRDAQGLPLEDPLAFLSHPASVAVSRAFAVRRGLAVGDRLTLDTPTGRRRFRVRGLLEARGIARVYGGNLVVMDLHTAAAVFARPGFINRVDIVVAAAADVEHVRAAITAVLPAGLRVEAPSQRKADLHAVLQSLQVLLAGVGISGLVAAFLIVFNRLATVFEGRAWQLGMLRAVGVPAREVWLVLLKESLILGAAGVGVGIPLGAALGGMLLPRITTTTALNYALIASAAEFDVPLRSLALAAGLGLGAAVLAALVPAWRAAHVPPAETVRRRGIERLSMVGRSTRIVRGVTLLAIVVAIVVQSWTRSPSWGLVATALIAAGGAFTARPLLHVMRPFLVPLLRWIAGPSARFAATTFLHNPRRAALTTATLGVGLGSVLWLWTLAGSFEQTVVDMLGGAYQGDLVVASTHVVAGSLESPVDDRVSADVGMVPGVVGVAGQRTIEWHLEGGPIAINAFDAGYFTDPGFGRWPLFGPRTADVWDAVAGGRAVVISSNLAVNLQLAVGDVIRLETPSTPVTLSVAGISAAFASPRGTVQMSRQLYQRYWHDNHLTRLFVRIDPATDASAVREAIATRLGTAYGLRISSCATLVNYFATQVRRAFAPVDFLAAMVLFVVLIAVADTLGATVAERSKEIGVIRAIGVERRHLRRMVMAEGFMLGVLGLMLAGGVGAALGILWVETTFAYLLGWVLELHVPYAQAGLTVAVTLLVCLAAAVIPAHRAAHLDPAVALRYE